MDLNGRIDIVIPINELKFVLLPPAPYSPDLAPSGYFIFQTWKTVLLVIKESEKVEFVVDSYFKELDSLL